VDRNGDRHKHRQQRDGDADDANGGFGRSRLQPEFREGDADSHALRKAMDSQNAQNQQQLGEIRLFELLGGLVEIV